MSDKIGNIKIFMTDDPIGQQRELIDRINNDSDFSLEKGIDMTLATNTSKLMQFPSMGTRDFESKGAGTYRSLRTEFFSVMISQMIFRTVIVSSALWVTLWVVVVLLAIIT